jgi:hypothetical protein
LLGLVVGAFAAVTAAPPVINKALDLVGLTPELPGIPGIPDAESDPSGESDL